MGARDSEVKHVPGAKRRALLTLLLACPFALLLAPAAQATFHEISIREVYPGGADNASYVELQMWAPGQELVLGHHLVAYNANGTVNENFAFAAGVATGTNQATILVADASYATVFPGKPAADATDANLDLSPAGGAACWIEGSPPDCVAWGDFTGPLPAHVPELKVGSPASPSGVTSGTALRRTIAPGCPTLLELADDSDDSAADFSEQAPNPRANATPIAETVCVAPTATIDSKPPTPTSATSAAFAYHSTPPGASFECRLDAAAFAACEASGIEYAGLTDGSHSFQVRAHDTNGTGTVASYSWTVDTRPPTATIKTHPADPSPGAGAAFTYQSDEVNSTFECSLSSGGPDSFGPCSSSGKTYTNLADGPYTFEVRATDKAGNQQPTPAEFSWEVDSSAADTAPPQTTLESHPPDPSESSTASFAYSSNEPGSSFECGLDGAPFASCQASGIAYTGLGDGPHSFQVRAIDPSGNLDPTPAGYSFQVALPLSVPSPAVAIPQALPRAFAPEPPPNTLVRHGPHGRTHDRTPTFGLRSNQPGARFECKLDRGPFRPCPARFTAPKLRYGRHLLRVRAVLNGASDPTPARISFKVVRRRR